MCTQFPAPHEHLHSMMLRYLNLAESQNIIREAVLLEWFQKGRGAAAAGERPALGGCVISPSTAPEGKGGRVSVQLR